MPRRTRAVKPTPEAPLWKSGPRPTWCGRKIHDQRQFEYGRLCMMIQFVLAIHQLTSGWSDVVGAIQIVLLLSAMIMMERSTYRRLPIPAE